MATIEHVHGKNLLKADADALVNTVNTVGVMGKGIALQFLHVHAHTGHRRLIRGSTNE